MRGLIPRKDEYDPIVKLLESDEYESAEALAKAILSQAYSTLLERDWFLTVVDIGEGFNIAYGLAPTASAAQRVELTAGRRHMILPVRSARGQVDRAAVLETPPTAKEKPVQRARGRAA